MALATIVLAITAAASADSLVINNLSYADVQITGVKAGEVFFTTSTGNDVRKPMAQVSKINLADEPAFNSAEEAFAARDWNKATASYEKTVRSTQKLWLADWCAVRLLESANKAGRFDAAVRAYIAIAEKSPDAVKTITLNMPKPNSAYLPEAATLLNAAANKTKSEATRAALLKLLVDVNNAKGDTRASENALERLAQSNAKVNPNSSDAQRAQVLLKLKGLRTAIAAKEYDKVLQTVEKDAGLFSDPADQAEALLCVADASAGKSGESNDAETWKEVAVAYMRVVVNAPTSSQAAAALLRVAAIHETKLGEKETALKLYQQIVTDYKDQDPARQAEKEIKRLKGA
jgi:tetratricopeptide (TPR) repeat protein